MLATQASLLDDFVREIAESAKSKEGSLLTHFQNRPIWVKFGLKARMENNLAGYKQLQEVIPTSKLLEVINLNSKQTALVFEQIDSLKSDLGLFAHTVHTGDDFNRVWPGVLKSIERMYTHNNTRQKQGDWLNYFTIDRLKTKLALYDKETRNEMSGEYVIKKQRYTLDAEALISETKEYFRKRPIQFCVLGQSDLNDRNITKDATILDYDGGGLNPLSAEVATFWVYYWLFTGFITPKYQSSSAPDFMAPFCDSGEGYTSNKRIRKICHDYFKMIEKNFSHEINEEFWRGYRAYATMRILCVVPLGQMQESDKKDMVAHLAVVQNAERLEDLIW